MPEETCVPVRRSIFFVSFFNKEMLILQNSNFQGEQFDKFIRTILDNIFLGKAGPDIDIENKRAQSPKIGKRLKKVRVND